MRPRFLEITDATDTLDHYTRDLADGPLMLTRNGHAFAAIMPFDDDDLESFNLSLNPRFEAIIDQRTRAPSRAESFGGGSAAVAGSPLRLSTSKSYA